MFIGMCESVESKIKFWQLSAPGVNHVHGILSGQHGNGFMSNFKRAFQVINNFFFGFDIFWTIHIINIATY